MNSGLKLVTKTKKKNKKKHLTDSRFLVELFQNKIPCMLFFSKTGKGTNVKILEVYHVKTLEVYHVKTLEVYHVKTLELYHVKTLEVYHVKTLEVYHVKTLEVYTITALEVYNATLEVYTVTILEVFCYQILTGGDMFIIPNIELM